MKNLKSTLTFMLCIVLLSSCFFDSNEVEVGGDAFVYPEIIEMGVTTNEPSVSADLVEFQAEIINNEDGVKLEYGFMWYDPNDETSTANPVQILIGSSTQNITFKEDVSYLPRQKDLVVCAFIRRSASSEPTIGNEVPFVLP